MIMKTYVLNIGEVRIEEAPVTFTCFGLGSCIGLFVKDSANGITGGAHILLPEDVKATSATDKFYNVKQALGKLFELFRMKGSKLENLQAKFVGGATSMTTDPNLGERNVHSVIQYLIANNVFISALDVGGSASRTAHYNSLTSELRVSTTTNNSFKVF